MPSYSQFTSFDEAWIATIDSLDHRWQAYFEERPGKVMAKWSLTPIIQRINNDFGAWSSGEQCLISVLVSFYNFDLGQQLVARAGKESFLEALLRVNQDQKEAVFELIRTYDGW